MKKKVKIYTFAFNRPDFIPLQQKSFLKNINDDYEFIVFNNARSEGNENKIKELCEQLNIKCIDVDSRKKDIRCGSIHHALALNFAFHNYIKCETNTIALLLDGDMFVAKKLSVNDYLEDYDVAGVRQSRGNTHYLHPGVIFFNIDKLPNKEDVDFFWDNIDGVNYDTGGRLSNWFRDNPNIKLHYMLEETVALDYAGIVPDEIVNKYKIKHTDGVNRFVLIEKLFLHYRNSSNYRFFDDEYHFWKTTLLAQTLVKW